MRVSASMMKAFMSCGQKAKFQYVDRLPRKQHASASFGSAVHMALEYYLNTNDQDGTVNLFRFIWDNPSEFDLAPEIWAPRTSFGAYRERGVQFIEDYIEKWQWVDREIVATEHPFCVDFNGHELSGFVDIIEAWDDKRELKIVDLKTGYRPNKTNLGYDVQFSVYMYAAQQEQFWTGHPSYPERFPGFENGAELYEKYKDYDVVGVWSDLRNTKDYPVGPRTQQDYDKLAMVVNEIVKAMEHSVFIPDISGDTCGICPYHDVCPIYEPPTDKFE